MPNGVVAARLRTVSPKTAPALYRLSSMQGNCRRFDFQRQPARRTRMGDGSFYWKAFAAVLLCESGSRAAFDSASDRYQ